MKSKYLSAAALLCAAGLSACGGKGNGNFALVVQSAVDRAGLVLQNNGGDDLTITGNGSFAFPTRMATDAPFNITIKTTPADVTCQLSNNTGKINYYTYQQASVVCTPVPYVLGGTVSGLAAENTGLVLANGARTVGVVPGSSTWQFAEKVPNNSVYGVTVLAQPAGKTCSVSGGGNGSGGGTMPARNIDSNDASKIVVTCQ
ncbi:hypothetical protein [Pseudoduganella violaceinigra]|uniref:hypothetical protein n=1 Tax=Pseudoduganella violaceinigra TaxID=246602 RepID=UPI0004013DF5|nr:hypothetical protein [Pseudoduganella violaceinigra]